MFRTKCIKLMKTDGMVDSYLTLGKFYNVIETNKAMDNIEYWSVIGDIGGEMISRPAWCFSRPLRKRRRHAGLDVR